MKAMYADYFIIIINKTFMSLLHNSMFVPIIECYQKGSQYEQFCCCTEEKRTESLKERGRGKPNGIKKQVFGVNKQVCN